MKLRVENVRLGKSNQEIKDLYVSSFPKEDQMPFALMVMMSHLWNTEFLAFFDDDVLCGFVYMATIGKQSFVMFMAVNENLHSRGYGSRILETVQSMHLNNRIIVSIEPCDEDKEDFEQRVRRKGFYRKNGYLETGYYMKLGGKRQEVLIKNGVFSKSKFIMFFMIYSCCAVIPRIWSQTRRPRTSTT